MEENVRDSIKNFKVIGKDLAHGFNQVVYYYKVQSMYSGNVIVEKQKRVVY